MTPRSQDKSHLLVESLDLFPAVTYEVAAICTALGAAMVHKLFKTSAEDRRRDDATMKRLCTSLQRIADLMMA